MLFYAKQYPLLSIVVMVIMLLVSNLWAQWREVDFGNALGFDLVSTTLAIVLGVIWTNAQDAVIYMANWIVGFEPFLKRFEKGMEQLFARVNPIAIMTGGLLAGVGEEVFFRGMLQAELGLIPTAIIFALLHFGRGFEIFSVWALLEGLVFGWLYHITGNLVVPIVVHGIHDSWGIFVGRFIWGKLLPPEKTLFDWLVRLNRKPTPPSTPPMLPPPRPRVATANPISNPRIETVRER
jgi:membrane protease YdiL (CAAX protease family)